ncbi:MAG: hypothetical protein CMB80_05855 [Flammeovirgaceae bacterium]|nr:hypothetical protein [Flammeovirgaceae bacterium]|tara:strand:- start:779 stop:1540 length:762 start_codon:yes stop_codon:yes gene_type:complete
MADFALFNSAQLGGTIMDTPKEKEFPTSYGGKMLSLRARLATNDEERPRQVQADINLPAAFRAKSRTAFNIGGNITVKGTLSSWIPEPTGDYKARAFLSVRTNAAIQKEVNGTTVLTSVEPLYKNEVIVSGVRVDSPMTGEKFDTPDKADGNIYYLLNSSKGERKNIIPVLLDDVPTGFDEEGSRTVWTVEGTIQSVTLEENHWSDVLRPDSDESIVDTGEFKEVSKCMVEATGGDGEDEEDAEEDDEDDVPF